ncbi:MAG: DUF4827 domain-containing protein [Tannerella sp.]|jgi:hypothetical protein|nr:DUF4827 domain-containing protein [Tannerella sp.]
MKKGFYLMTLAMSVLHLIFVVSCNDTPTYEELKSAEQVIIKRIIAERGIEVLSEYPTDGVFGKNQFVELSSGIYMNVIDSGNGVHAQYNATTVLMRVCGYVYDADPPYYFNSFGNTGYPFEFKYGLAYSVVSEHQASGDNYYLCFGMGLESALQYVGDSAWVKLIVPGYSEISDMPAGSTYQSANTQKYYPIYYDSVRYVFW